MLELVVLADDLTGALEAGAAFAQNGIPARVIFDGEPRLRTPVLVIDTETRHAAPETAMARTSTCLERYPARLVYKKTDSTLRGQIRAELMALSRLGPIEYMPAYPRMGRTLRDGCLYVDGVPLAETSFACDGDVNRLVAGIPGVAVLDANTDEQIRDAARRWLLRGGAAAGPAAMAHAAAELMNTGAAPPAFPLPGRVLVATGSRHPCSLAQAAAMPPGAGWKLIPSAAADQGDPLAYAAAFSQQIVREARDGCYDTLVIFGGDTARAVIAAFGIDELEPLGEVLPGMPLSRLSNGMTLITKAGGFGPPDILAQLRKLPYAQP